MDNGTIEHLIQIKSLLISCVKNNEINEIIKNVDDILLKNCRHQIVNDVIDIDPDKSKSIQYCEKCYITFQ
jgi:hypothetical protein